MNRTGAAVARHTHAPTPHYVERSDIFQLSILDRVELIADMTPARRLTAVAALFENPNNQAARYRRFVEWDERPVPTITDTRAWLATTPLVRALVADLPSKRGRLAEIAERARHESTCTGAGCDCVLLPAVDRDLLTSVGAAILEARRGGAR